MEKREVTSSSGEEKVEVRVQPPSAPAAVGQVTVRVNDDIYEFPYGEWIRVPKAVADTMVNDMHIAAEVKEEAAAPEPATKKKEERRYGE